MSDDEHLREIIRTEIERIIDARGWPEAEVQRVLLEVAKDHLWKQGLYCRIKYWTNIIGFFGVIGTVAALLASLIGLEVIRK